MICFDFAIMWLESFKYKPIKSKISKENPPNLTQQMHQKLRQQNQMQQKERKKWLELNCNIDIMIAEILKGIWKCHKWSTDKKMRNEQSTVMVVIKEWTVQKKRENQIFKCFQ